MIWSTLFCSKAVTYVPQSESSIWIAYLFIFFRNDLVRIVSQQGENFSHIGDQIGWSFEPCHYVHVEMIKINLFGWWTQKCFSIKVQNPPQPLTCNCFMWAHRKRPLAIFYSTSINYCSQRHSSQGARSPHKLKHHSNPHRYEEMNDNIGSERNNTDFIKWNVYPVISMNSWQFLNFTFYSIHITAQK